MQVTAGDRLSQMGQAFLNMLVSQEETDQLPHEKRARRDDVSRSMQRRRQTRQPSPPRSEMTRSTSSTRDEEPLQVTKLCRLMGQLLVRHEDSLNSVSMQDSYVMFFQRATPEPCLATQSSKSMARPTSRPDPDALPLLPHPGHSCRAGHTVSEAEDPAGGYRHQSCGSQESDHPGGLELSLPGVARSATTIGGESVNPHLMGYDGISFGSPAASLPGALQLCPILRDGLSTGDVIPWKLQVSLRNDSLSSLMRQLTGSSLWHLIGAQMKQHGLQRSKIAQDIQDILHPRKGKK